MDKRLTAATGDKFVYRPGEDTDYKLIVKAPDASIDFKLIVAAPRIAGAK